MILVVVAFFATAGIAYYLMAYGQKSGVDKFVSSNVIRKDTSSINSNDIENLTPTPISKSFPFEEMTLPSLRRRNYKSSLGELQKLADKNNFSSYLTSYDSDGLRINGYLTIPHGQIPEGGWPAVVFVHGYIPPQEYETTKNYVSYADALADYGLVVFKIDLRGHGQSEGEPMGAYYSESYVVDTLNAYRALQKSDFVNPDKIGLWGHSMGGNVVFRSKVVIPEIQKVVIWAGAVFTYEDFSEYKIEDNSYQPPPQESERIKRREELFDNYGEFDPNSEFWKQIVPTNYLEDISGDFQIHHAIDDNIVSIEYSRNLEKIFDADGIENQLYEYRSGGHNITSSSFDLAMQRSADFLTSY